MRCALSIAGLLLLAGCSAVPHSRAAGAVASLAVRPVEWNAASAPVGNVSAVADAGDVVAVFADDGVSILSARAVVARDTHVKGWTTGDTIDAADGVTRWIVGIDEAGRVQRLKGLAAFEDVTPRYGLAGRRIRSATMVGKGKVGFLLDGQVVLAGASKLAVFPTSTFTMFAGGGGFGAGVSKNAIDVINGTNALVTRFTLPGVTWAALDAKGRLYAATPRAVYAADSGGALALVYDAGHEGIHGLVASGDRVWFADRGELGVVEGDHVAETTGANLATDAKLQASPSGDVWVIAAGKLQRYSALGGAAPIGLALTWGSSVAPVFARSCASCHQPDGVSGVDLSSEAAWQSKRALIRERVLVAHTMPPQGHPISDADREAIHAWIEGAAGRP